MLKLKPNPKAKAGKDLWSLPRLREVIFLLLVFLLPTQLAYHFWPTFSYVYGLRVDYLAPTIYFTDLLFLFLLLSPFFGRLKNELKPKTIGVLGVFLILVIANVFFARSPPAALIKWLIILKLTLFVYYVKAVPLKDFRTKIVRVISWSLLTLSLIGILQFVFQRTLGGPLYFLGERTFTAETPGMALVNLFGKPLLRAYSTFPHPNALAGYLIVAFLIFLGLGGKIKWWLIILLLAFLLTFSSGAFLGAFLVIILFGGHYRKKSSTLILSGLIVVSLFSSFLPQKIFGHNQSVSQRVFLTKKALTVFAESPLWGKGLNNFIYDSAINQPVHNLFLLTLSETGLIGLVLLFLLFIYFLSRTKNRYFLLALYFILITGLFDHYWLTLNQNLMLTAFLFGIVLRDE